MLDSGTGIGWSGEGLGETVSSTLTTVCMPEGFGGWVAGGGGGTWRPGRWLKERGAGLRTKALGTAPLYGTTAADLRGRGAPCRAPAPQTFVGALYLAALAALAALLYSVQPSLLAAVAVSWTRNTLSLSKWAALLVLAAVDRLYLYWVLLAA